MNTRSGMVYQELLVKVVRVDMALHVMYVHDVGSTHPVH